MHTCFDNAHWRIFSCVGRYGIVNFGIYEWKVVYFDGRSYIFKKVRFLWQFCAKIGLFCLKNSLFCVAFFYEFLCTAVPFQQNCKKQFHQNICIFSWKTHKPWKNSIREFKVSDSTHFFCENVTRSFPTQWKQIMRFGTHIFHSTQLTQTTD